MKFLTHILVFVSFSQLYGQSVSEYKGIETDLRNSAESTSFIIRLPNSFHQIGLFDTTNFESNVSDPCIFINTNADQNLKIIDVLASNGILNQTYWSSFDGDDFVDNINDEIILFQDVKIYIDVDFETPGHFDKVYLPITDYKISRKIIDELSVIVDQTQCFTDFKKRIKT